MWHAEDLDADARGTPGGDSADSACVHAPAALRAAICSIVTAIAAAAPSWAMILLITARLAPRHQLGLVVVEVLLRRAQPRDV